MYLQRFYPSRKSDSKSIPTVTVEDSGTKFWLWVVRVLPHEICFVFFRSPSSGDLARGQSRPPSPPISLSWRLRDGWTPKRSKIELWNLGTRWNSLSTITFVQVMFPKSGHVTSQRSSSANSALKQCLSGCSYSTVIPGPMKLAPLHRTRRVLQLLFKSCSRNPATWPSRGHRVQIPL